MGQKPIVSDIVHYTSYGTPRGEHTSQCRAAIVTEVCDLPNLIGVCVLNPTGQFFHPIAAGGCPEDELPPPDKIIVGERATHRGGTWHWPGPDCT